MDLRGFLDGSGIRYQWLKHPTTYTARDLASSEHVPQETVIKPVVVEADGRFVLCAVPAGARVDLERLQRELDAKEIRLAEETEMLRLFEGCEIGAEPPIGLIFGLPTIMDEALMVDDEVTFQAGTHVDAVKMSFTDYFHVAKPAVARFALQR